MNIHNATIITTIHHLLSDLKIRHLGGDLFVEATSAQIHIGKLGAPTFLLFDEERHFAMCFQETDQFDTSQYKKGGILMSPLILREHSTPNQVPTRNLWMSHNEYREMSAICAYWFVRAKSGMNKENVLRFLHTTYGDLSLATWSNLIEIYQDLERFFRDLKQPLSA